MTIKDRINELYGAGVEIVRVTAVSGSDINEVSCIELSSGVKLLHKSNHRDMLPMFEAETAGLKAIASTGAIRTPAVVDCCLLDDRSSLLMEYISGKERGRSFWEDFGHNLAMMHSFDTAGMVIKGKYGFISDNYIGSKSQDNTPCDSWIDFFGKRRLSPQFKAACHYFDSRMKNRFEKLMERIPSLLTEPSSPALLHGDLWSGNFIIGNDGGAWLIDPSVYVGHPEADIAMTELFGGFDDRFYAAYRESGLLQDGYEERRDIYNLYHMLNHLNMFGRGYYPSVAGIINKYF